MSATGTPKASEDAIAAVQDALGCANQRGCCHAHRFLQEWTERGCPIAVAAADAATPHIAAQAWLHGLANRLEAGEP